MGSGRSTRARQQILQAAACRGGGGQKMQAAADTQGQGGAANNSQQMQAAGQGKAHVYRTTFSVFLVKINRKLLETILFLTPHTYLASCQTTSLGKNIRRSWKYSKGKFNSADICYLFVTNR